MRPIPPSEILIKEFMEPYGLTNKQLANKLYMYDDDIDAVVANVAKISAEMAIRLSTYFGGTPHFWLNLQRDYDVQITEQAMGDEIRGSIIPRVEK